MSGVKMDDECKARYDEIQKGHKHRYVVYHIKDDKEIKVEKVCCHWSHNTGSVLCGGGGMLLPSSRSPALGIGLMG